MTKTKSRSRHSSNANYIILALFLVLILIIVTGVAIVMNMPKKKPLAHEYLSVVPTPGGSLGEFYDQNKTVIIKILGLNITAVGGDASDIIVTISSQQEPEWRGNLSKGETWSAGFQLQGLRTVLNKTDGLFHVQIGIKCAQTDPEYIWLYLNYQDIIPMSAA
jgi:hypothetical protein